MSIPSNTSVESSSPQPSAEQQQQQQQQTVHTTGTGSQQQQQSAQPVKRSSRRANTAERRATHNAVERARRETLNGRFLDLAAMLPNLAAVRRPSKSAIVNSSIALIHNSSRSRIIAARELRLLNAEANALRTELNEWRMRNNLPRVEEPVRSTDFSTLLAVEDVEMGEEMVLGAGRRSFDDGFGDDDNDFGEEGDEEQLISPETAGPYGSFGQAVRGAPMQYPPQQQQQQQAQQQQQLYEQQKAAMARAHQAQLAQQQAQRYSPPVIQQPQVHHQHTQSQPTMMFPADLYTSPASEMYQAASWSQKAINTLTPPGSAHGQTKASPYANTANTAFLTGHQQQSMFKPTSYNNTTGFLNVGSEDDQSDGSSHFSEMGSLVEQPFSFGLSSNTPTPMNNSGFNMGSMMGYGQMNMGMMQLPPSPPHTSSPASSQVQSRRPSVNIPSGGSNKSSPGPSPLPNQYGMALMI